MASFDTSAVYSLTNDYTGPHTYLASNGEGSPPVLRNTSTSNPAVQWTFSPVSDLAIPGHWYWLRTIALGSQLSLDVLNPTGAQTLTNASSATLNVDATQVVTGQLWRIDPWGDGTYKLSNNFTGLGLTLDVYQDVAEAWLDTGKHSGQFWSITAIKGVNAPGSSASLSIISTSLSTSTSASTPTSWSTSASSSTAALSSTTGSENKLHSNALSGGAIAGIVIGVVVGIALVAALLWLILRRRKQNSAGQGMSSANLPAQRSEMSAAGNKYQPEFYNELAGQTKLQPGVEADGQQVAAEMQHHPYELPADSRL